MATIPNTKRAELFKMLQSECGLSFCEAYDLAFNGYFQGWEVLETARDNAETKYRDRAEYGRELARAEGF